MADEIRSGDSKVRVVRLLGHRDDAGAWEIRDFLKRSVVEFQWIELSTEEDCRRELGLSDLKNVNLPVVELPDGTRLRHRRSAPQPQSRRSARRRRRRARPCVELLQTNQPHSRRVGFR
jgi:hypothetical protein